MYTRSARRRGTDLTLEQGLSRLEKESKLRRNKVGKRLPLSAYERLNLHVRGF